MVEHKISVDGRKSLELRKRSRQHKITRVWVDHPLDLSFIQRCPPARLFTVCKPRGFESQVLMPSLADLANLYNLVLADLLERRHLGLPRRSAVAGLHALSDGHARQRGESLSSQN